MLLCSFPSPHHHQVAPHWDDKWNQNPGPGFQAPGRDLISSNQEFFALENQSWKDFSVWVVRREVLPLTSEDVRKRFASWLLWGEGGVLSSRLPPLAGLLNWTLTLERFFFLFLGTPLPSELSLLPWEGNRSPEKGRHATRPHWEWLVAKPQDRVKFPLWPWGEGS